jgi:hypothetical protein
MIRYKCDQCGASLKIKDKLAGTPGKCPKCKKKFTVPEPDGDSEEPASKSKKKKKKGSAPAEISEEDAIFGQGFFEQKDEPSARPSYAAATIEDDDDEDDDLPGDRVAPAAPPIQHSKENAANIAGNLLGKTGKKNSKEDAGDEDGGSNYDYSAVTYVITRRVLPAVVGLVVLTYVLYNFFGGMMSDERAIPKLAIVSGVVTLNGTPQAAELTFNPILLQHEQKMSENVTKGANSKAWSLKNGKYSAMYSGDIEGAILGKHSVKVVIPKEAIIEVREIEVKEGVNTFNFEIKKPAAPST